MMLSLRHSAACIMQPTLFLKSISSGVKLVSEITSGLCAWNLRNVSLSLNSFTILAFSLNNMLIILIVQFLTWSGKNMIAGLMILQFFCYKIFVFIDSKDFCLAYSVLHKSLISVLLRVWLPLKGLCFAYFLLTIWITNRAYI